MQLAGWEGGGGITGMGGAEMEMLEVSESGPGQQQFPSAMLLLPRPNLSYYNTGREARNSFRLQLTTN
jgi:hypothetical protein